MGFYFSKSSSHSEVTTIVVEHLFVKSFSSCWGQPLKKFYFPHGSHQHSCTYLTLKNIALLSLSTSLHNGKYCLNPSVWIGSLSPRNISQTQTLISRITLLTIKRRNEKNICIKYINNFHSDFTGCMEMVCFKVDIIILPDTTQDCCNPNHDTNSRSIIITIISQL